MRRWMTVDMPRILLAEDDPQVADMVRLYFEYGGLEFHVDRAESGIQTLEMLEEADYDLLLLDLMLPDLDGLAVLGCMAAKDDPTPVIVVTSHGQEAQTVSALRAGAIHCVNKKTPQFLQIVAIANDVLAKFPREARLPRRDPADSATILFADESEGVVTEFTQIALRRAPWIRVAWASSVADLQRRLALGPKLEAIVVGRLAGLEEATDALRLARLLALGVPLLFVATEPTAETVVAALHLGCQDCILSKPGYLDELFRSLCQVLRRRAALRLVEGTS